MEVLPGEREDELWQLDIKGPFKVRGQKYWFPVCADDYSCYLLVCDGSTESRPPMNSRGS